MAKDSKAATLNGLSPDEISANDRVIVVMGLGGAGKSTFIEAATRQNGDTISHSLLPGTTDIRIVKYNHPRSRMPIVLVDTPGFDSPDQTDMQILKVIAKFLRQTYNNNVRIAGIIYTYRIADNRMANSCLTNFHMFCSLCGDQAAANVVLATTMWSEVEEHIGDQREDELLNKYWNLLMAKGARSRRFKDTFESAWEIVDAILEKNSSPVLDIQEEMHQGRHPHETAPGRILNRREKMAKAFKGFFGMIIPGLSNRPKPESRHL